MSSRIQRGHVVGIALAVLTIGSFAIGAFAQTAKLPSTTVTATKAPTVTGLTLNGSQIKASAGYVLERNPKVPNQMTVRMANGPLSGSATCKCSKGTGACNMTTSGDIAICSKDSGNPCGGSCEWSLNAVAGSGAVMR